MTTPPPLNLDDQQRLIEDVEYVQKVAMVSVHIAIEVIDEPEDTPNHPRRVALASSVLQSYKSYQDQFAAVAVTQLSDDNFEDAELYQIVRDSWSMLAGIRG